MTSLGKSIIGIIIIGLIVLGGYFYTRSSNDADTVSETEATTSQTNNQTVPVSGTTTEPSKVPTSGKKVAFSEFIKQGGSYSCTVSQTTAEATSQGKVFISGDKVRGEFTTTVNGQTMTMSFLALDGYTYTWTSMMPTMGYKIKSNAQVGANSDAAMASAWNASSVGDYNCEAWSVDATKFEVPSSVTFRTMAN
jgi:hypothetical protein